MAVFLEDVSPHELQHTALPHTSSDDLTKHNLLAVAVLERFLRHAETYGMTLTKLISEAGKDGPRESQISRAYNVCIERGYLGRIEFSHSRPAGDTGNGGKRATFAFVSRVPLSDGRFAELVARYAPGRYVIVPIDTGEVDDRGQPVYEQRRVKVLAAEIYCARGALRIAADGSLSEHANRRGKSSTERSRKTKSQVTPEPENPGSGATSANTEEPQVTPEPENPGSINKTDQLDQPLDRAGGEAPPPGPRRTETDGDVARVVTDQPGLISNHLNARAFDKATVTVTPAIPIDPDAELDWAAQAVSRDHPDLGHAECVALAAEQLATGLDREQAMLAIRRTLAETAGTGTRRRRRPATSRRQPSGAPSTAAGRAKRHAG